MPNMVSDGFLHQANFANEVAITPPNSDYQLQSAIANAVSSAAILGALTTTVAVAAYTNALVQLMMQRLTNMGYTSSLSGTTLTVNW